MIEKIISIENVGTFSDYKPNSKYNWDGRLSKINLIFAPNGSGKTTLATIFNSLSNISPELLTLKQTINKANLPLVKLKCSSFSGLIEYSSKKWNQNIGNILVFDIHFIEDNLFLSSISNEKNTKKISHLILSNKGTSLRNRFLKLRKKQVLLKRQLEDLLSKSKPNKQIDVLKNNLQENIILQNHVIEEYSAYAFPIFENYVKTTNAFLRRFTNNVKINGFYTPNKKNPESIFNVNLVLDIDGKILRFKQPDFSKKEGNVKFSLSEGDKNAVALSFFLALAEIKGTSDKVIIFDDPLSSFDYIRRTSTVNILSKLAQNSEQFILATHDIGFAKSLKEKLSFTSCLNLKIEKGNNTSFIALHDIEYDTMSGYQKDLNTIKSYKNKILKTDEEKRKVIRCIRPIIETIFKIKYSEDISYNEWLGDIIGKIRKAEGNTNLEKLKPILPDIIDLNDFSKKYHHSELDNETINDVELNFFIDLLQKTIVQI